MNVTLITPTRNRPWCFARLESYIDRQTVPWSQWLAVCDQGTEGYKFTMGQQVIERESAGELHSINQNYLAALEHVTGDAVLCVEDDDWYAPCYVEEMVRRLEGVDLAGCAPALYYHVGSRKWRDLKNEHHCSLACTGFTRDVFDCFRQCCLNTAAMPFIDMVLWPHWRDTLGGSAAIFGNDHKKPLHVGLKGCPGNHGAGLGHDPVPGIKDIGCQVLRRWLGADAKHYVK